MSSRRAIFLLLMGWSNFSYSVSQYWVSDGASVNCKFLVSNYFREFLMIPKGIILDLEKLAVFDKRGFFDKEEFYTFQSNSSGSTRTLTLIKTDEKSWVVSIPDQFLGCRMAVTAISSSEREEILEGIDPSLDFKTIAETTTTTSGELSKKDLQSEYSEKQIEGEDKVPVSAKESSDLNQDIERLRSQLEQLKNERRALKTRVDADEEPPKIDVSKISSSGGQGLIGGRIKDNVGVAEVRVQGKVVRTNDDGEFLATVYVPEGGANVTITATDFSGLQSKSEIFLERIDIAQSEIKFDKLDPLAVSVKSNPDAIALIVGISEYENVAKADFADNDAAVFADYVKFKLGVIDERVILLSNEQADITGMLLSIQDRLNRSIRKHKSDVYIFFAGHGLASDDGGQTFLIPYDGSPRLLARTAISRDELFKEITKSGPRSVTVFLDTCYAGDTRGETRLVAARPLGIKVKEQSVPDGFTIFSAAAGDQTAKPLKEAQHGLFSYFLMKGMEGGADANSDNQITARELHTYVRENVVQQSGGSQVPELQGDGERVLVRFQ